MRVIRADEGYNPESSEVICILVREAAPEKLLLDPLHPEMRDACRKYLVSEDFKGKEETVLEIPFYGKGIKRVVVCGMGKCEGDTDKVRVGAFRAVRSVAEKGLKKICLYLPGANQEEIATAAAEGSVLAGYRFDKYMTNEEDDRFAAPSVVEIIEGNEIGISAGVIAAESQIYAKSLANEPGNVINPVTLAKKAEKLAEEFGLGCEVWDEKRICEERMEAYYAVGKGSATPPRFIRLTWSPENPTKHIVLVGKGITFDSGGLNVKPADYMKTMKGDKSGACAVLGAIRVAALAKAAAKVTVLIAAAENMPGGSSYRPDDLLTARNGKTIEINNTDAEGRLTLADALVYASELKPDMIVDIATLTGACCVALGSYTAGLFSNNDDFAVKILQAAKKSGERFWRLPLDDPYLRKSIKSSYADLVNSAGRYGGAITAAMFLEAFVDKDIPWAHIDMAPVDFVSKPWSYYTKGATGFGTRTLANLIIDL